MSTDRELLELAAKAAGIQYNTARERDSGWILSTITEAPDLSHVEEPIWNPLGDDGDALRLAVKLEMLVDVDGKCCEVICRSPFDITERIISDPMPAARRAIVRAAAEIGRAMQ